MMKLALREAWARKRRLFGTACAVFLGVALLSGTFVLSDTLGQGIKGFFANSYSGVDVVVRSARTLDSAPNAARAPIPRSLVAQVTAVPGVAEAQPVIDGYAQIVGPDGKAVTGNGPRMGGNWLGTSPLNPYRLAAGRGPSADDEVVIDKATADAAGLRVGSRTSVLVPEPHPVTVVGIARFGRADAFGGSSYVGFSSTAAQRYLALPGQVSSIEVRSSSATGSDATLAARIADRLPADLQVITGAVAAQEATKTVDDEFLSMFKSIFAGLAAISLLVAIFSIFNTQSILSAQRTRESALLRAIGASRRQVLAGALGEAAVVGVAASALGVAGGVGIAFGLKGIFAGMNLTLPGSGLSVQAAGALIAFVVGVLVTVGASLVPAIRASRVAPLAALRDVESSAVAASRPRTLVGLVGLAAGVAVTVWGVIAAGPLVAAAGSVLLVAAAIVAGPGAVVPGVRTLAAIWSRRRKSMARLAMRNAQRDPHRIAGAGTALLVGTALVACATVLAGSLRSSIDSTIAGTLRADLVVSPANANGAPASLSPRVVDVAARTPGVRDAAALGEGNVRLAGSATSVTVADPARLTGLLDLGVRSGSAAAVHGNGIAVRSTTASDHGWRVGSPVGLLYPDGRTVSVRVAAIFSGEGLVHDVVVPTAEWARHSGQPRASNVLVSVAPGASAQQVHDRLAAALKPFGQPPVRDKAAFIDKSASQISFALNLVYAMLALAIVIAVLGIGNTISLSVFERTRELGLLRAVGLTRRQARSMVRAEAVLVSGLGSLAGVVLGAVGGAAVVAASDSVALHQLTVPTTPLLIVLVGGALSGVVAAARPARRAARLSVLSAIAAN